MDEPRAAEKYPGSGRGRSRRAAETRKASARPDGASGRRLKRCGGMAGARRMGGAETAPAQSEARLPPFCPGGGTGRAARPLPQAEEACSV